MGSGRKWGNPGPCKPKSLNLNSTNLKVSVHNGSRYMQISLCNLYLDDNFFTAKLCDDSQFLGRLIHFQQVTKKRAFFKTSSIQVPYAPNVKIHSQSSKWRYSNQYFSISHIIPSYPIILPIFSQVIPHLIPSYPIFLHSPLGFSHFSHLEPVRPANTWLPANSGPRSYKPTLCDIENGPVEIVDLPSYKMVIFHSYVSLP